MLVGIVTDSSSKINGIMKLLRAKKGLDAIVDSGKGQDEPVCGEKILSMTLFFPRSGVKTFVCPRNPL